MRLIGYVRLSKAGDGHSLDAQRNAIARWCASNGHDLVSVIAETGTAKTHARLPGRSLAIAATTAGLVDAIVVRELDRVTRSTLDGANLLEDARTNGWRLLGAHDGLDTGDAEQEVIINIRIALAQEERRKLARRTKEGMAAAKRNGSKIGKPRKITPALERRIVRMAAQGQSAYAITKHFNKTGVPTPEGGPTWSTSVVRAVIARKTKAA